MGIMEFHEVVVKQLHSTWVLVPMIMTAHLAGNQIDESLPHGPNYQRFTSPSDQLHGPKTSEIHMAI